jgi:prepilin-type N-terminal cleavage/methylation domain-containing protein
MKATSDKAFTLLEIMLTMAIVGVAVVPALLIREQSKRQSYQARNANIARTLARELMSEIEFHGLDPRASRIEGYPGFEYEYEIEQVDLVSGEEEDEQDQNDPYNQQRTDSRVFTGPGDAIFPEEQEQDDDSYLVRRVKLTIRYPNLKKDGADQPNQLVIETILPALPEEAAEFNKRNR